MREFKINQNDANQRLDKFLSKAVKKLPKNLLYKYIRLKRIKVNGKRCEISTRLSEGDVISLYINDEFFDDVSKKPDFMFASSDIDIVYEDENIMLLNKKCGLVVHEDNDGSFDTLINRVLRYLYEKANIIQRKSYHLPLRYATELTETLRGLLCVLKMQSL